MTFSVDGSTKRIIIVTEANELVATGHLYESIELGDNLAENGYSVMTLINKDAASELKEKINYSCDEYDGRIALSDAIRQSIVFFNPGVLVFDLREIKNEELLSIREYFIGMIICIDEWGHRRLDCDVIINPMVDSCFWDYKDSPAEKYFGGQYLVLPRKIHRYHEELRNINERVKRVCISMGGVDKNDTTQRILKLLPPLFLEIKWDVVIGGGNSKEDEIRDISKEYGNVAVHKNISYIYNLFCDADIAFCAGGNTLHELACLGTPMIVIPTMPHEYNNGKYFEKAGAGVCLPLSEMVTESEIVNAFRNMLDSKIRINHSENGKRISKGNGVELTTDIIDEMIGRI